MIYYRIMLLEEEAGKSKQSIRVLEQEEMYRFLQKYGAKKQGIISLLVSKLANEEVEAFFRHE